MTEIMIKLFRDVVIVW